jgi:5-methylcytosine-specific restriction enzyme subunit McrC
MFDRKVYSAIERGSANIPFSDLMIDGQLVLYEDVQARGYFNFSLRGDKLALVAGDYVGYIPLNSQVALLVEPKTGRSNWLYIVGKAKAYLRELNYLRNYVRSDFVSDSLVEFLARAFIVQLVKLEEGGLYRQYLPRQELTSFPKGRILFNESIQKTWCYGHSHSVAVKFYTFSQDNPHNRLIKYALNLAINYLTSILGSYPDLHIKITEMEDLFGTVPLDNSLNYLPVVLDSLEDKAIPDIRSYYYDICRTAILLVENTGLKPVIQGNDTTLSFVVNMGTVYEDYCFNVLFDAMNSQSLGSATRGKEDNKSLFSGPNCDKRHAEPDIIIRDHQGNQLPIEVKYKSKPNRQDINQAVTYAIAYEVDRTLILCYARQDDLAGWHFLGTVGGDVNVWIYRINIASADIEAEETKFVSCVNQMLRNEIDPVTLPSVAS